MREDEADETFASPVEKPAEVAGTEKGKGDGDGFSSECNVCMSAPVQVVLIPCGHACLCRVRPAHASVSRVQDGGGAKAKAVFGHGVSA